MNERKGKLSVGYGYQSTEIGPELGFGWDISRTTNATVLIIKAAYGGATMAGDFRPPSSPPSFASEGKLVLRDDRGNEDTSLKPGHRFIDMLSVVNDTLSNLTQIVPEEDSYIIKGFVWFQGFSDAINRKLAPQYEMHLTNFVKDVRQVLSLYTTSPEYPFLIGELGMQGLKNPDSNHLFMRKVQRRVAQNLRDEFFTRFVPTSIYVPNDRTDWDSDGAGRFHYNGRADTYYYIGQAFAKGIVRYHDPLPTDVPTSSPRPSPSPSAQPQMSPSLVPSVTYRPTASPSIMPTESPQPSPSPTGAPTGSPQPSPSPTSAPTESPRPSPSPSAQPQMSPSARPSTTYKPTALPSIIPTESPQPSPSPTTTPTDSPRPTPSPSYQPQMAPSDAPSTSMHPTIFPTTIPTESSRPTPTPSQQPQIAPSRSPSISIQPTSSPTVSRVPSKSRYPTNSPAPSPSPSSLSYKRFHEGAQAQAQSGSLNIFRLGEN
eukprot:CAMPEP_0194140836 /NCGR_PEP_ID=MMETSP0152-20130528/10347_1 /TAXON_ID=1049557 /ORGANISM="Thalassiothrix antarctica, Strain L6-D1" /LENGTH=486 /DNA_ID=CAMNT_0038839247 /DNA_START=46 /DNA_END=1506 /DNA_ORIENTATION=+